ncbi:TniQ family protein [Kitasatospora phosalacinea]|uniref:TniQ domain-containing protein n=1 Tax=Kitasatospora phosalacinea TaxID=2065 RepID=A0A9W6PE23_9ACTN|nr:TniQ family protein [Kitasatospora phosalacinea]GLW53238.1 hypothetical protein Kpho01_12490 [Kitasatospora phosalacinea]
MPHCPRRRNHLFTGPVVPRRLAAVPAPLPNESLTSWLHAMARGYELPLRALLESLGLRWLGSGQLDVRTTRLTAGLAQSEAEHLSHATGLDLEDLAAMTIQGIRPDSFYDRAGYRPGPGSVQAFCPACLRENAGRWFLDWLEPHTVMCPVHQRYLAAVCSACGTPLRVSRTKDLDPAWCTGTLNIPDHELRLPTGIMADPPRCDRYLGAAHVRRAGDPTAARMQQALRSMPAGVGNSRMPVDRQLTHDYQVLAHLLWRYSRLLAFDTPCSAVLSRFQPPGGEKRLRTGTCTCQDSDDQFVLARAGPGTRCLIDSARRPSSA